MLGIRYGTLGASGYSGYSGESGYRGESGYSGIVGASGLSGASGATGVGLSGYSGVEGLSGAQGVDGESGYSGISGATGGIGESGYSGVEGLSGISGAKGDSGFSGAQGLSGTSGISGQDGESGASGLSGIDGASGSIGESGYSGASGTSGTTGADGASGYSGYSGSGGGVDEEVKVSSSDTTPGYLNGKLVAGAGITLIQGNSGANEILTVSLYVPPSVSLGGGSTVEIGSTIVDVPLSWTCNKAMLTRLLSAPVPIGDRDRGAGQNGSYTHVGANLVSNTTYSITVGDGTGFASGYTYCTFRNRRYYGINAGLGPLSNPQILALNKEFCSGRANTHTYNCTGGTYIWICYPASFGLATFKVGGLEVTFTLFVQDVTNDSGYVESFNCYRSTELQNGSDIEVVVT